jgi:DNA-binding response OmpR family regulator
MGIINSEAAFMRKRILIVEDDPALCDLLFSCLKAAGYSAETAADGLEALRKARSSAPDLILLDLMLPKLDGFSVCETLREDSVRIPIIMLTGLSSQLNRFAGLGSGADDYITKPFTLDHLLERIKELLKTPAQADTAPAAEP